MRDFHADEYTMLVVEDCNRVKSTIKDLVALWRSEKQLKRESVFVHPFPFVKIKGPPLFAEKKESALLQVADVCAFLLRGYVSYKGGKRDLVENLFRNINGNIFHFHDLNKIRDRYVPI